MTKPNESLHIIESFDTEGKSTVIAYEKLNMRREERGIVV
jgi:hypothetical protein